MQLMLITTDWSVNKPLFWSKYELKDVRLKTPNMSRFMSPKYLILRNNLTLLFLFNKFKIHI